MGNLAGKGIISLVLLVAFAAGYGAGHGKAGAEGRAKQNILLASWEEERRERAEAYGKALAETLEQYRAEAGRADAIATRYAASRKTYARESESLQRRIARVESSDAHTFSPDFVRMYNEAIGLSGDALSKALCAFDIDGTTGTGSAPGTRERELFTGVSEKDLLRHIARYGSRCRAMEAQLAGWQALGGSRE